MVDFTTLHPFDFDRNLFKISRGISDGSLTATDNDGSLTATDLIYRINSQLTSEKGAPVSVNGIQLHLMEMSSDRTTTMTSLLVGLFLGGFGSSTLIWLIVIVIIL